MTGVNPQDNSIHKAKSCPLCARTIIQAGINKVYLRVGEGVGNYMIVPAKELDRVYGIKKSGNDFAGGVRLSEVPEECIFSAQHL